MRDDKKFGKWTNLVAWAIAIGLCLAFWVAVGWFVVKQFEPKDAGYQRTPVPARFMGDTEVLVIFGERFAVESYCSVATGHFAAACADIANEIIRIETPCGIYQKDGFTDSLCLMIESSGFPGGTAMVEIEFLSWSAISGRCAGLNPFGCRVSSGELLVLNPCLFRQESWYAELLCHEVAHTNGWPASHPMERDSR